MVNDRIPKDVLYGERVTGTRTVGRPYLNYKDTCKRDTKMTGIDINNWETVTSDRGKWRSIAKMEINCQKWHERGEDRSVSAADVTEIARPESDF